MLENEEYIPEYNSAELFERLAPNTPFVWFGWIMFFITVVMLGRLIDLQIVKGAKNFFLAEGNRIREIVKPAPRGIILDRNNEPLVKNVVRYSLALVPGDLPKDSAARHDLITKVASASGLDAPDLERQIGQARNTSFDPIIIKDNISRDESLGLEVALGEEPGVVVQKNPTRDYLANGFSHLIGTIGKISKEEFATHPDYAITNWIGKSGVEAFYEDKLRGRDGGTQVEVNARGQVIRLIGEAKPQKGEDVTLTVDTKLQEAGMQALRAIAKKGGAIVALNPKTGEVLALGSFPDYDANVFLNGDSKAIQSIFDDPLHPLINRPVSGAFPSGSTIKPFWATAALAEGTISEHTRLDTSAGQITVGAFQFNDWKTHGVADVRQAIAESNNIFFFAVAGGYRNIKGLGPDKLATWAKKFGLSEKTGIDLPGETNGFVPTPAWKKKKTGERWFVGDTYNVGIGQGNLLVSPLQMSRALGAVATGQLATPRILKDDKPELKQLDAPAHALEVVRDGMRMAVTGGSAHQLQDIRTKDGKLVEVAAKTGTAQIGSDVSKTHGWMEAFAPYDDPQIVVVAFVEEGGEGHATAGPIVKAMLQNWFGR